MGRRDSAAVVVPQSVDDVYRALTDPAALVNWLPPTGMTGRFAHYDLRPGGSYRMVLTYLDATDSPGKSGGDSDVVEVRFVDVVPGERIVQAVVFDSADPAFAGSMTMTWSMAEVDDGTQVEILAKDVPAGISAEDHAAGMQSSLDNLARWLGSAS